MDNLNFFKDLLETKPDYKKIVILIYIIQNDKNSLREVGFSERDIIRSNLEFKFVITKQHEEYLVYVKMEEELFIEIFLNKLMGNDINHLCLELTISDK